MKSLNFTFFIGITLFYSSCAVVYQNQLKSFETDITRLKLSDLEVGDQVSVGLLNEESIRGKVEEIGDELFTIQNRKKEIIPIFYDQIDTIHYKKDEQKSNLASFGIVAGVTSIILVLALISIDFSPY